MESIYPDVRSLGGEIVLIGPETEEDALELMDKTQATIPLLHDTAGAVAESYRLMFDLPPRRPAVVRSPPMIRLVRKRRMSS